MDLYHGSRPLAYGALTTATLRATVEVGEEEEREEEEEEQVEYVVTVGGEVHRWQLPRDS